MTGIGDWLEKGIHQGNSLEVLRELPSESVNAVITDPPYNISKDKTNLKHYEFDDIVQEFGEWDKNQALPHEWVGECERILKENGVFISFYDNRRMEVLRSALEHSDMNVKGKIYWVKPNPVPQMADHKFTEAVEEMWFATKNEGLGHHFNTDKNQRTNAIKESNISSTFKNGGEIVDHPTQKPKRVIEPLIEYHTYKGDIVLDPFVGSGTTCVVSQNMNREWIGIEREEEYVQMAEERIEKETNLGQESALSW